MTCANYFLFTCQCTHTAAADPHSHAHARNMQPSFYVCCATARYEKILLANPDYKNSRRTAMSVKKLKARIRAVGSNADLRCNGKIKKLHGLIKTLVQLETNVIFRRCSYSSAKPSLVAALGEAQTCFQVEPEHATQAAAIESPPSADEPANLTGPVSLVILFSHFS